jgi:hypothetical protein
MSEIDLRASDAERDATAERLRSAAAEGRLTSEELEERLERALLARTRAELDAIVADLPALRPPGRGRRRKRSELAAFAGTAVLLVVIWALSGMGYFWPAWPILGWGFFVLGPGGAFGCSSHRHSRSRAPRPAG